MMLGAWRQQIARKPWWLPKALPRFQISLARRNLLTSCPISSSRDLGGGNGAVVTGKDKNQGGQETQILQKTTLLSALSSV